jgi:hypothetical protein
MKALQKLPGRAEKRSLFAGAVFGGRRGKSIRLSVQSPEISLALHLHSLALHLQMEENVNWRMHG